MKKNLLAILSLACLILFGSCAENATDKKAPAAKPAATAKGAEHVLPNYRYVDIDTVLSKYQLAIEYSEAMLENSIKAFANSMQNKYQNNQYTSEQAFNADQTKLQQMQNNASASMEKMQRSNLEAAAAADKTVQDSIHSFIERYNAKHHYDAILMKAATLYIDPALDITEEVVEGLNAGYTKVKK